MCGIPGIDPRITTLMPRTYNNFWFCCRFCKLSLKIFIFDLTPAGESSGHHVFLMSSSDTISLLRYASRPTLKASITIHTGCRSECEQGIYHVLIGFYTCHNTSYYVWILHSGFVISSASIHTLNEWSFPGS